MAEIRTQDLRFNEMEIKKLMTQMVGIQVDSATAAALAKKTEGWVTGLLLAAFSARDQGHLDPALLGPLVDAQYVMEYLFTEVFSRQPSEFNQYLMNTAILDRFCGPLCEAVFAPGGDPSTCKIGGWEFIAWLKEQNLFLIPLDNEKRWFRFHHLFQKLLLNQLNRHLGQGDINALHAQASDWFAENGMIEEALKHTLAAGNQAAAARLIARHGFDLLDHEQWSRLERWLRMLPADAVDRDPGLLVLMSWLHVIYARAAELRSCLDKAEALTSARTTGEHIQGHLDALCSFYLWLTVNGEQALTRARRACETIPRNHRWARIFAFIVLGLVHQLLGDRAKALSTIDEAMRDPDLSGGGTQGFFQANPCFIHWIDADLTNLMQTAGQALKSGEVSSEFQAIAHGLYFLGIAYYHRNELHAAEEYLAALFNNPYSQHALNFAHGAFALALVHQARSREDEANQVGETVISYAFESKNPDLLKVAQAFQAELALRQRRFREAFRWMEQYKIHPLLTPYRFYLPQITAVKILLAQETSGHRRQAADLLNRLHDFLVAIHNFRFQIDVLALKALLFDAHKDQSAADKALTESLTIAEPGGFIRPFVDLGPPMADLLKRLHRQGIAVDYIEKLLTAFREDAHSALPDASVSNAPSPHHPHSPSPRPAISQPQVEPLTNRELDVLELLAQRWSNKEIAEKLFISTVTVKGHLLNIYGKLNVRKRREAVEKAKKIGILSEEM